MKIEAYQSSDDKKRWKLVRTDNYTDIPGDIVSADEATGDCAVINNGETKTMSLGASGIRIVERTR